MEYCILKFTTFYFLENQKEPQTENRYPLRSRSKVSISSTEGSLDTETVAQETDPSPNKRQKLEISTLGKNEMIVLVFLFLSSVI